jgi:hypothetical protein
LFSLKEGIQYGNLDREVETAWSLDTSPRLLVARYDPTAGGIYV